MPNTAVIFTVIALVGLLLLCALVSTGSRAGGWFAPFYGPAWSSGGWDRGTTWSTQPTPTPGGTSSSGGGSWWGSSGSSSSSGSTGSSNSGSRSSGGGGSRGGGGGGGGK